MIAAALFIIFSSAFSSIVDGHEINFRPGPLMRELKELDCSGEIKLTEMALPLSDKATEKIKGKFFTAGCGDNQAFAVYIGRVNSCRIGGCSTSVADDPLSEYEFFDYYILFDSRNRIISVRIFNYEATHGQEITAKGWLKQFAGFDGSGLLRVGKEIDSVSGATVSVYSLVNDIRQKTDILIRLNTGTGNKIYKSSK